jgi:hypothetical protein
MPRTHNSQVHFADHLCKFRRRRKDSFMAKPKGAPRAAPVNSDLPPIFCFARQTVCRQTERGPAAKKSKSCY